MNWRNPDITEYNFRNNRGEFCDEHNQSFEKHLRMIEKLKVRGKRWGIGYLIWWLSDLLLMFLLFF